MLSSGRALKTCGGDGVSTDDWPVNHQDYIGQVS